MLNRLQNLEENVVYLRKMREQFSAQTLHENKFDEWALRYGIFESIQIVIDIACHLSSKYNLGVSTTYAQCIENLQRSRFISSELAKQLIGAIGLRNMLIHEYVKIDVERLLGFLALHEDFSAFALAVKEVL